jgi:hypothetical protein
VKGIAVIASAFFLSLCQIVPAQKAPSKAEPGSGSSPSKEGSVGVHSGGRHGDYTRKAAQGPHMKVVAATYFGTDGYEEFVDAGGLPDGTIVVFGNAWGPKFPTTPAATVIGSGRHTGAPAVARDGKGNDVVNRASPDMAGMIVLYTENLSAIKKAVRMDWGVASILAGLISGDGKGLVIAGRCQPNFASFASMCPHTQKLPYQAPEAMSAPAKGRKPAAPSGPACDVYITRLTLDLKPQWIWVLEKNGDPPEDVFTDNSGAIYFDAGGMRRVSPDGKEIRLVNSKGSSGTAKWLGVDPTDGGVFYGGDRNTHTGQQPYRQPYLYKFDETGKKLVTLWEPDPKTVGSATGGLESDSSPRALAWAKSGEMLVGGWSDGGNSVFPRQALDWHKPAGGAGMGMQTWGMKNANSLGHIMRIDPKTWDTKSHTWWASFIPAWFTSPANRGAPNFANIEQIRVLNDGSVAITGSAATGLIQTPNPFWTDPMTGNKYGGRYVAIFKPDLSNLLFSSYLPGLDYVSLGVTAKGAVSVGRSEGKDSADPATPSPVKNALQAEFAGATDAHIVVFQLPQFP